jgi:uncharacterized protein (DUF58 family)
LIELQPESRQTDFSEPLRYLTNAIKKRSIAFLISDFMGPSFTDSLRIASNKHDMVALRIGDRREKELPALGMIRLRDAEIGEKRWVDTSLKSTQQAFAAWQQEREKELMNTFRQCGVDHVDLMTGDDYIKPLVQLFKRR